MKLKEAIYDYISTSALHSGYFIGEQVFIAVIETRDSEIEKVCYVTDENGRFYRVYKDGSAKGGCRIIFNIHNNKYHINFRIEDGPIHDYLLNTHNWNMEDEI